MNTYFNSESTNERGTIANFKVTMGQHSVGSKVMECFNHVEDMCDLVCDGLIVLLAMNKLGLESCKDMPHNVPTVVSLERLVDVSTSVVNHKGHHSSSTL